MSGISLPHVEIEDVVRFEHESEWSPGGVETITGTVLGWIDPWNIEVQEDEGDERVLVVPARRCKVLDGYVTVAKWRSALASVAGE